MAKEVTIQLLDPITFEYQSYSEMDTELIVQTNIETSFYSKYRLHWILRLWPK